MILGTALRQQGKLVLSKRVPINCTAALVNGFETSLSAFTASNHRNISAASLPVNHSGAIQFFHLQTATPHTRFIHTTPQADQPLALSASVIEAIKADLVAADKDSNGKIDADELKDLLRKHNSKFTDDEIVELGDLFYAASSAEGVAIEKFIEALEAGFVKGGEDGEAAPFAVKGKFKTHPLGIGTCASEYMYAKTHGKYTQEELDVKLTHVEPKSTIDKAAFYTCKLFRFNFDFFTGWNRGVITTDKILNRAIFLETVAAIPGMVAAIIRHFRSLRNMARDGGMLNMFLEEANNERMHLLTFIRMKDPGYIFRATVIGGQFVFGTSFLVSYILSPAFCHRFVGYIEEEACSTYTKIIEAIETAEEGTDLGKWRTEHAPKIAKGYWHLGENGTVLDLMKAVRADEAEHRDVNHAVSGVAYDTVNPLYDPRDKMDNMLRRYVMDMMERGDGTRAGKAGAA